MSQLKLSRYRHEQNPCSVAQYMAEGLPLLVPGGILATFSGMTYESDRYGSKKIHLRETIREFLLTQQKGPSCGTVSQALSDRPL